MGHERLTGGNLHGTWAGTNPGCWVTNLVVWAILIALTVAGAVSAQGRSRSRSSGYHGVQHPVRSGDVPDGGLETPGGGGSGGSPYRHAGGFCGRGCGGQEPPAV